MPSDAESPLDVGYAHRYFASNCFNFAWTYIDRSDRSPQDDEAMVLAAAASLWHWTQREDCTPQNFSIGHWQLSRAYAAAGLADNAMRHALRSLEFAAGGSPFYIGYGHEAVARAACMLSDGPAFQDHSAKARALLASIDDESERLALQQDLDSLPPPSPPAGMSG
jgi:hypothetical protein